MGFLRRNCDCGCGNDCDWIWWIIILVIILCVCGGNDGCCNDRCNDNRCC